MTQETELKPCPFCGGEETQIWLDYDDRTDDGAVSLCCVECGAKGPNIECSSYIKKEDEEYVRYKWSIRTELNKLYAEPTKAELIESLERILHCVGDINECSLLSNDFIRSIYLAQKALEKAKGVNK